MAGLQKSNTLYWYITTSLILWESQIIAQKPPVLSWCFHETCQFFEVYRNNQNQWFFYSCFFHIPRSDGCLILIFQIPRAGSFTLNFSTRYPNLVIIYKSNAHPTQILKNHISFAHLYGEFYILILESNAMFWRVPNF